MTAITEKIQTATDVINGKINIFDDRFKKIYPFTTENIGGYLDKFKLKGTKLLTVGSSADQTINASLFGCRDITLLDICPYAKEHFFLKDASLQSLSKQDFERFLFYKKYHLGFFENARVLDKKTFERIMAPLQSLDEESAFFWQSLISTNSPSKIRKKLFSHDEYSPTTIRRINPYLQDEESYLKTRVALQETNVTFLEGDIMNYELSDSYDNIFLSNIPCNYSLEQTEELIKRLIPHLNPEGSILISYLYSLTPHLDYCDGEAEIYDILKAQEGLPKPNTLSRFESVNGTYMSDGVLVYKKQK